jgi:hypothetical protein
MLNQIDVPLDASTSDLVVQRVGLADPADAQAVGRSQNDLRSHHHVVLGRAPPHRRLESLSRLPIELHPVRRYLPRIRPPPRNRSFLELVARGTDGYAAYFHGRAINDRYFRDAGLVAARAPGLCHRRPPCRRSRSENGGMPPTTAPGAALWRTAGTPPPTSAGVSSERCFARRGIWTFGGSLARRRLRTHFRSSSDISVGVGYSGTIWFAAFASMASSDESLRSPHRASERGSRRMLRRGAGVFSPTAWWSPPARRAESLLLGLPFGAAPRVTLLGNRDSDACRIEGLRYPSGPRPDARGCKASR